MTSRMRSTRGVTGSRRSHQKAKKTRLATDGSGSVHARHRVSRDTGMYRGRQVLGDEATALAKTEKKAAKKEALQTEAAAEEAPSAPVKEVAEAKTDKKEE